MKINITVKTNPPKFDLFETITVLAFEKYGFSVSKEKYSRRKRIGKIYLESESNLDFDIDSVFSEIEFAIDRIIKDDMAVETVYSLSDNDNSLLTSLITISVITIDRNLYSDEPIEYSYEVKK